ncbi:MAG: hypothetical protein HY064_07015 [Bacteroidetes bacterium]|nr:hypothetical protein [Bacteroidota bacterium]
MKKTVVLIPVCIAGFFQFISAQNSNPLYSGQIHGNFEIDAQYYKPDSLIGADSVPEKALFNGWSNVNYTNGNFSAGVRYESYLNHLQGYPQGYAGTGIPYRFASYNNDKLEITVGSSYEQFGSGLTLRCYEERALGLDNALDGFRVRYNPYKGIYVKGVWGKQRNFMTDGPGIVRGIDGEVNLNELFDSCFAKSKTQIILGANFVSKYQADLDPLYVLPQNVGCWSERMNIIRNRVNFYAEYAYKINDPSSANGYIYKPGNALFSSLTYSQKGLGIYLGLLRIDNFSYRSDRTASLTSLNINYIPALTKQHTYALAAYYPFSSQPTGELSWQGEIDYKLKKGSKLGGTYGTDISLNYSAAYAIDTTKLNDHYGLDLGYTPHPFKFNDSLFFQDINLEIFKKINHKLKGTLLFASFVYNKNVMQGKLGYPLIHSYVAVADIIYKVNDKLAFRTDAEHMLVQKNNDATVDYGNWASVLEEISIGEHFFIAGMDQYNYGNPNPEHRIHYYSAQIGYSRGTNRIVLGYGKQRAGIFCVGGVCRQVPASNGFTLTITSSF